LLQQYWQSVRHLSKEAAAELEPQVEDQIVQAELFKVREYHTPAPVLECKPHIKYTDCSVA
jgi:hypothetical protein